MRWGTEILYPALHTNAYCPQDDWVLSPNLPGLRPPVVVLVVVDTRWCLWGLLRSGPARRPSMPEVVCRDCQSLSIIWGRYS